MISFVVLFACKAKTRWLCKINEVWWRSIPALLNFELLNRLVLMETLINILNRFKARTLNYELSSEKEKLNIYMMLTSDKFCKWLMRKPWRKIVWNAVEIIFLQSTTEKPLNADFTHGMNGAIFSLWKTVYRLKWNLPAQSKGCSKITNLKKRLPNVWSKWKTF